jgi:hypothetical protein
MLQEIRYSVMGKTRGSVSKVRTRDIQWCVHQKLPIRLGSDSHALFLLTDVMFD